MHQRYCAQNTAILNFTYVTKLTHERNYISTAENVEMEVRKAVMLRHTVHLPRVMYICCERYGGRYIVAGGKWTTTSCQTYHTELKIYRSEKKQGPKRRMKEYCDALNCSQKGIIYNIYIYIYIYIRWTG
jgi:hypothetical protein